MEIPTVTVEFELTPEDWAEANLAHLSSSRLQRDMLRRARFAGLALFAALALISVVGGAGATGAVAAVLGGFAFAASVGPLQRSAHRRALERLGRDGVANGTFGRHRVEVREEGLLDVTSGFEWLIRWTAIEAVEERGGTFFVYPGRNSFLPIPATAFSDAETLRSFADAFYRRVALHERDRDEARDRSLTA